MSDYFGALMRSSGLIAAGVPSRYAARDALPAAVEETFAETGVPANGVAATGMAAPARDAAAAVANTPSASGGTHSPAATPAAQAEASIQRVQAAAVATPPPAAPTALPFAAAPSVIAPGARRDPRTDAEHATNFPQTNNSQAASPNTIPAPTDASSGPTGTQSASRVRAALQWIAADPNNADPADSAAPFAPHAGSAPRVTPLDSPVDEAIPAARLPLAARERDDAAPVRSNAIEAWLREPAMPSHASRRQREHDDAAGDLVEVSIGAIHLRVDAPAAQTRMAAAPTAATAPRTTNRAASRDAVARRLLRRI